MAKFKMSPEALAPITTVRLGAGSGSANYVDEKEIGKAVKLVAESRYGLASAGDPIEGFITTVETWTADDFSIGGIQTTGRVKVTLDGDEATPGTGTIAVGDYVVTGTVVAKGTALSGAYPKVCKATNQPGATVTTADNTKASIDTAIAKLVDAEHNSRFAWRVVSLDGTTAVGQTATIERVGV
jgi:hypothetical protein